MVYSPDRKSSELSIFEALIMIRGTPEPPDQKVYNRIFIFHGSTNPRNAFREAAHMLKTNVHASVHIRFLLYKKEIRAQFIIIYFGCCYF